MQTHLWFGDPPPQLPETPLLTRTAYCLLPPQPQCQPPASCLLPPPPQPPQSPASCPPSPPTGLSFQYQSCPTQPPPRPTHTPVPPHPAPTPPRPARTEPSGFPHAGVPPGAIFGDFILAPVRIAPAPAPAPPTPLPPPQLHTGPFTALPIRRRLPGPFLSVCRLLISTWEVIYHGLLPHC